MRNKLSPREHRLTGLGVSPGVAIAPMRVRHAGRRNVPLYHISPDDIELEWTRLSLAAAEARHELRQIIDKADSFSSSASEQVRSILEVHVQMLDGSRLLRGIENRIREQRQNAAWAVQEEAGELASIMEGLADRYLAARAEDVRGVADRLLRVLAATGHAHAPPDKDESTAGFYVLITDNLSPADAVDIDPQAVSAFVTESGGADSHTAILARSIGIPAVLAVENLLEYCHPGDTVVVDGDAGIVIVHPSPATIAIYTQRLADNANHRKTLESLVPKHAVTACGKRVFVRCNIDLPREVGQALQYNCEGIGLLRTEFLYLHRRRLPGEEEQFEHLRAITEQMGDHLVTVRTLDLGGEKLLATEDNSAITKGDSLLGLRAIRLCLAHPEIFRPQLRAILRASSFGNMRILLPMVSRLRDVTATRALLTECAEDLQAQGYNLPDRLPPLGVMIEVPAAALIADELAEQVDFFSIGTNDLTMYTLAVDRGDERMLDYYQPRHKAVLKLIEMTVVAADKRGIPVSVCGEMAADPVALETLIRLGVREVSVAPPSLLVVKDKIRQVKLA